MNAIAIAKTLIRERANLNLVKINENIIALKEIIDYQQMLVDLIYAVMRARSIYNFLKSKFIKQHNVILNTVVA